MKFVFYTNSVSPHQLPLAKELVRRLGADNYRYVSTGRLTDERRACGWTESSEEWIVYGHRGDDSGTEGLLEEADTLLSSVRDLDLFESRARRGLLTLYVGERWFKPVHGFSGKIRLLVPSYRRMVARFVSLVKTYDRLRVLPIGVHAWKDMLSIGIPQEKMTMWGYFVAPSLRQKEEVKSKSEKVAAASTLRLLYVGRLVALKRVDTIIKAVGMLQGVTLTIVGDGPEKESLMRLAAKLTKVSSRHSTTNACNNISFLPSMPIGQVRDVMREHDVLVFASNGRDGWGAVVSEALEEGMNVVGTYETGAAATILPASNLFHSGDVRGLAEVIRRGSVPCSIGEWSAACAAERLLAL